MSDTPATKKDQILELARRDPFLKVEEIAATAATTPRYVRTILSEAKVSLMQLRRRYARNMERRLGIDVTVRQPAEGLTAALVEAGKHLEVNQVRVMTVVDADSARILGLDADRALLQVSRLRLVSGRPFFVNQVVTHRDLRVAQDVVASEKPLRQLLGLEVPGRTEFVDRSVEVVEADPYLALALGLAEGSPVFKSGNVILTGGERVGIEYNFFDALRVRFVLAGASDYVLKIVEKF